MHKKFGLSLSCPRSCSAKSLSSTLRVRGVFLMFAVAFLYLFSPWGGVVAVRADNFTDIFATNTFRGSFEWFKYMDWVGMVVQAIISIFSLLGTSLIVIRVMTSLLYLSARGLWEEVHDMKETSESQYYDFGLLNMAKSWAKGKSGFTGLDAFVGAVLMLLPDIKRYSDFGDKSGQKFDQDISMSQYVLKIALPFVLALFILSMGFNGTLWRGMATTVDAMGTFAERAVSINYAGFVEDLLNSGSGYKFTYGAFGTKEGKFKEEFAKDLYGKVISNVRDATPEQFQQIGVNVQNLIDDATNGLAAKVAASNVAAAVKDGISNNDDRYWGNLNFRIIANASETGGDGTWTISLESLLNATKLSSDTTNAKTYYHVIFTSSKSTSGTYYNIVQSGGTSPTGDKS